MSELEKEVEELKTAVAIGEEQRRVLDALGWRTELDAEPHGTEAMLNFYRAEHAVHSGVLSKILIEIIENDGCPRTIVAIIRDGLR